MHAQWPMNLPGGSLVTLPFSCINAVTAQRDPRMALFICHAAPEDILSTIWRGAKSTAI